MDIASNAKERLRMELEIEGDEVENDGNSAQVQDIEPLLVVEEAISIKLIASEIFRHLSHRDLLNCSLVNTVWNASARVTLREDRQSFVRIGGRRRQFPCEELKLFWNIISKSWNHPFNGFSFTFSTKNQGRGNSMDHICPSSTDNSEPAISNVINQLLSAINIKYLRIFVSKKPTYVCPVAVFMADIIRNPDLSKNLVGLLIDRLPNMTVVKDVSTYFSGSTYNSASPIFFPNIKLLKLPDRNTFWGITCPVSRIFKQLLLASPRVTDIKGCISLDIFQTFAQLPVTRSWILHDLKLEIRVRHFTDTGRRRLQGNADGIIFDPDQLLDFMLAFVDKESTIKIRNLTVKTDSIEDYYIGTLEDMVIDIDMDDQDDPDIVRLRNLRAKARMVGTKLLQSPCKYIRSLEINSTDLHSTLKQNGTTMSLKLNQLSHLTVESTVKGLAESLISLSNYGFEFFCPNLRSVELVWKAPFNYMDFDIDDCCDDVDDFNFNTTSCCPTVTQFAVAIQFDYSGVDVQEMMTKCMQLFPNVKTFVANMAACPGDYMKRFFEALWTAWPALESVQLKEWHDFAIQKNVDYLFTGISNAKCRRFFRPWKIWSDEQFNKLQEAPSLLNLTKLKQLQIQIVHNKCTGGIRKRLDKVFLSELTGHFIFRRMPQLKVHIRRTCCDTRDTEMNLNKCRFKLKHLQNYVQFDPAD